MSKKEDKNIKVIKVDINKNDEVYKVCEKYGKLAKDLYNFTNYKIRQIYLISKRINDNKEIAEDIMNTYNSIVKEVEEFNENTKTNKIKFENKWSGLYIGGNGVKTPLGSWLKDTEQFKALPSTASKEIIGQVSTAWQSYFASLEKYFKDKSRYKGLPKPPKYKNINGESVFTICKETTTIKDGYVSFKKPRANLRSFGEFNISNIKVPLPDWDRCKAKEGNLTYIRVVPKNSKYTLEFVYSEDKIKLKEQKGRMIGIDLGIDRLATVSNTIGEQPFCINGNPLKSINKQYNKDIAKYKSLLEKVNGGQKSSNRIKSIHDKRNARMETYIHQASSYIINWCLKHDIDTIVAGKNTDFKYKTKLGKETQTFVQIPLIKLLNKIKYKAEYNGINYVEQDESYTSKASFVDNDYIPTYGKDDEKAIFNGFRSKRGLYVSRDLTEIHADVNGAYNIIRKYDNNFTYNEKCKLHPYIIQPNIKVS